MAQYLLLFSGGSGMPETKEEQDASMQAWTDWFAALGPAVTDPGNPFTGNAKTLGPDGSVTDGAISASGYSILEADSLAAAADLAKGCPVLESGAQISVHETMKVM